MKQTQTLKEIQLAEFKHQWNWAYYNWHGKFIARYKKGKKSQTDKKDTYTFFIWNGAHVRYREQELIPRRTLVYGTEDEPRFISFSDFLENFDYTNENPIKDQGEAADKAYMEALNDMKKEILQNSKG